MKKNSIKYYSQHCVSQVPFIWCCKENTMCLAQENNSYAHSFSLHSKLSTATKLYFQDHMLPQLYAHFSQDKYPWQVKDENFLSNLVWLKDMLLLEKREKDFYKKKQKSHTLKENLLKNIYKFISYVCVTPAITTWSKNIVITTIAKTIMVYNYNTVIVKLYWPCYPNQNTTLSVRSFSNTQQRNYPLVHY